MHYLKLDSDFEVKLIEGGVKASIEAEKEVDRIWQEEAKSRAIFNGSIFNLVSYDSKVIRGFFVEYRYFLSQRRKPDIDLNLNITPLGVSGITSFNGRVLMGKRADHLFSHVREFEFVPSGSIDKDALKNGKIDVAEMLFREFEEETKLSRKLIKNREVLGFFRSDENVCDIAYVVELKEKVEIQPTEEYSSFQWIPFQEVEEFCNLNPVIPLTHSIWREWLKLFSSRR